MVPASINLCARPGLWSGLSATERSPAVVVASPALEEAPQAGQLPGTVGKRGGGGDNAERTESETRRAAILRHPHSKPPSRTTRLGSRARPPRVVLISLAQTASVRAWHLCKSSSEERNEAKGTIVQGCHANPILPADMVPTLFPIPVSLRCHAKCC